MGTTSAIRDEKPTSVVSSTSGDLASKLGKIKLMPDSMASQLFSATAKAKIWTSRVAMHLERSTRDRLFRQLDLLHDADEWVDDGAPVKLESYKTCVRAILYHQINSRPALSLMPSGNILALWQDGDDKLTIEFLPSDQVRWIVQSTLAIGTERAAGTGPLERLRDVLQPYGADRWFNAA